MKHSRMRKWIVPTLALTLVMGLGTPAFAQGGHDNKEDSRNNKERSTTDKSKHVEVKFDFKDTQGKDYEWAFRYIMSLASRRIFEGYPDGTFKPQETVSRIEAITAAVRLMGLRDQAESSEEMATKLNFTDAAKIPSWAVGYVAVALENDLFSESDTNVNPNQPADRLWATTLLVKALKLQDEAEASMNAKLPFKDASSVPAGSVGYVKVAVDKGLVNGFDDQTFRPKALVTRAQIAALLDRAGNQLPNNVDGLLTGTVAAPVSGSLLTVTSNGRTFQLTLDSTTFIYRAGARVSSSALQAGDIVKVRSYENNVIYIEVTQLGDNTTTIPTQAIGVKTGMVAAPVTGNTLTLVSNGQTLALPLQTTVLYFRNGVQIAASGLQLGDVVSTRSYNNGVAFVEVTQPAGTVGSQPSYDSTASGTLAFPVSDNVLLLSANNQIKGVPLNNSAIVYRNGALTNVAALKVGDVLTTYAYNNFVAVIEVTRSATQLTNSGDMTGTIVGPVNNNLLTIINNGQSYSLQLHANTSIYLNGAQTTVGVLLPGDTLTVHYKNGIALFAEVSQRTDGTTSSLPTITQTTGTIVSSTDQLLIIVNGTQAQAITLNNKAFVYRGGTLVTGSALKAGESVTIRSYNNSALYAEVTQLTSGSTLDFNVSGTFKQVTLNNQGKIATITINQTSSNGTISTTTYNVASSVTITGNIANLVTNHAVILQGTGAVIQSILIP